MVIALLIGREGSKGFPGKNVVPVLGRPMMSYPLLAARHSQAVDVVYVSTDSPAIRKIAEEYGAIGIDRPPHLCTETALGEDAFLHGYRHVKSLLKKEIELVVLLFCNGATILAETIDRGIDVLRGDDSLDSAVTVSRYNMWSPLRARKVGAEGLLQPFVPFEVFGAPGSLNCDRDSQGDVWFADMSASVVRPRCLERMGEGMLPQRWMGQRIYPLKQWGGLDVDYDWQVPQVEFWLKRQGFTERSTPYDQAG